MLFFNLDLCTNRKDTMSPSLCTIYKCQGETSRASFKRTNHQQTVSTDTPGEEPHPNRGTKLRLPVPLRDKKESNESIRQRFSSIYHSASESTKKNSGKRGFMWEGSKPRTLVASENMFGCLYMSGYILFDMCIARHTSTLPFSLFSNIYIKASKKYNKQHVPIHSLHLNSAPKGLTKI